MDKKENKGGDLSNRQVEQDVNSKKHQRQNTSNYSGSQDTGDQVVRSYGTEVQKNDGLSPEKEEKK